MYPVNEFKQSASITGIKRPVFITTDGLPRIGGDNRDFSIAVAGEVMQMDNGIFFKEDEAQKQTS